MSSNNYERKKFICVRNNKKRDIGRVGFGGRELLK